MALVACDSGSDAPAHAERACELLAVEQAIEAPPPAMGALAPRSLGSLFVDQLDPSGANTVVFVAPDRAAELDSVADEVAAMTGIEVVEVVDQDATYAEFAEIFTDQPQLVETVDAEDLPPSVRVAAADADLDRLVAWADGDPRIQEVVDGRDTAGSTFSIAARAFPEELEELEEITAGDLHEAIVVIRSSGDSTMAEIVATHEAMGGFIADNCSDP
jgi:hypothetical protein